MPNASHRFVVIIAALLTLIVLVGATLAAGFRNGWLRVATDVPSRDAVAALAQLTDAERAQALPAARDAPPSPAVNAGADQSELATYRQRLEEAYRTLDDAYAQIRALQAAQSRSPSDTNADRRFGYGDDDHRERGSRRESGDD